MNNCVTCENAQLARDLHNGRCPQCRKDRITVTAIMAVVIPLLITFGWAMLTNR